MDVQKMMPGSTTNMCRRVHLVLGSRIFLISFKMEFWEKIQGAFLGWSVAV